MSTTNIEGNLIVAQHKVNALNTVKVPGSPPTPPLKTIVLTYHRASMSHDAA
jgi:hypothetical protein